MNKKQLKRIKIVLLENNNNKWLSQKRDKDPATTSKCLKNEDQPHLTALGKSTEMLEIKTSELNDK